MITLSRPTHWVFAATPQGEKLFQVDLFRTGGRFEVEGIGKISYSFDSKTYRPTFESENKEIQISAFPEGSAAVRANEKFRSASMADRRMAGLAVAFAIVGLCFLGSLSVSDPEKVAKMPIQTLAPSVSPLHVPVVEQPKVTDDEEINSHAVAKSTQESGETDEGSDKEVRVAQPARTRATSKSRSKKDFSLIERAARSAFQKGDFAATQEYLQGIQDANGGKMPETIRSFAAEVEYAQCQKNFSRGAWKQAVSDCESAVGFTRHARARRMLRVLEEKARKFYLEGYVMEGMNPKAAIDRYRVALASAPTGSVYRSKAATKLKGITGGIPN